MVAWKNLDTLTAFEKLKALKNKVDIKVAMAGENGAKRVNEYKVPMAEGMSFNYAAEQVAKYKELCNGAIINTGENRRVLHQLARKQQGDAVVVDGVDKRAFYVE